MKPGKHLILAVPLAALAIAGCGGGGDEDSTTAPVTTTEAPAPLSKEELLQQGDAICAEVNAAIGGVAASEAEIPEQTIQTADLYVGMVDSLQDLGEPEDTAGYPEFIAAAEALSQIEGEIKLAAERGDTGALGEAATEATPLLEEFRSTASAYGFENCSEGPSAPVAAGGSEEESAPGEEEVAPEEVEVPEEEVAPEVEEEVAPETGGAGGGAVAPEEGGGTESGGGSGGIGPG